MGHLVAARRRRRLAGRSSGTCGSVYVRSFCESPMDELHGHCSFTDGGRAALGRARAHVACGEDARQIRLEDRVCARAGAREDEAVVVTSDHVAEPFGAWQCAKETEQEREGHTVAALEGYRFELAVVAVQRSDLAAIANRDAVALELSHEVVGHRLAQVSAAMKQRHQRAATR